MPKEAHRQLAQTLGDLAIRMQGQASGADTLRSIVKGATDIVPGARWGGISMIEGRSVNAQVPTDPIVAKLDDLQTELGDGPCLTALRQHRTVLIEDMAAETRWPQFTRKATELGVRSVLSFQLFVESENLGALNLYGDEASAFSEDSIEIGTIVAQHAAVAMFGSSAEGQFRAALSTRDIIGQAKGMLMERFGIDAVSAFKLLTGLSQETNTPLRDIAQQVVDHPGPRSQEPLLAED